MTDFRALCADLTQTLKQLQDRLEEHYRLGEVLAVELDMSARLLDRADAALTEQPRLKEQAVLDKGCYIFQLRRALEALPND